MEESYDNAQNRVAILREPTKKIKKTQTNKIPTNQPKTKRKVVRKVCIEKLNQH